MPIFPLDSQQHIPPEESRNTVPAPQVSQEEDGSSSTISDLRTQPSDTVLLSEDQIEYERIQTLIHQLPEVRHSKVQELRDAITSGKYQVSSEDVAEAIFRDIPANRPDESR